MRNFYQKLNLKRTHYLISYMYCFIVFGLMGIFLYINDNYSSKIQRQLLDNQYITLVYYMDYNDKIHELYSKQKMKKALTVDDIISPIESQLKDIIQHNDMHYFKFITRYGNIYTKDDPSMKIVGNVVNISPIHIIMECPPKIAHTVDGWSLSLNTDAFSLRNFSPINSDSFLVNNIQDFDGINLGELFNDNNCDINQILSEYEINRKHRVTLQYTIRTTFLFPKEALNLKYTLIQKDDVSLNPGNYGIRYGIMWKNSDDDPMESLLNDFQNMDKIDKYGDYLNNLYHIHIRTGFYNTDKWCLSFKRTQCLKYNDIVNKHGQTRLIFIITVEDIKCKEDMMQTIEWFKGLQLVLSTGMFDRIRFPHSWKDNLHHRYGNCIKPDYHVQHRIIRKPFPIILRELGGDDDEIIIAEMNTVRDLKIFIQAKKHKAVAKLLDGGTVLNDEEMLHQFRCDDEIKVITVIFKSVHRVAAYLSTAPGSAVYQRFFMNIASTLEELEADLIEFGDYRFCAVNAADAILTRNQFRSYLVQITALEGRLNIIMEFNDKALPILDQGFDGDKHLLLVLRQ